MTKYFMYKPEGRLKYEEEGTVIYATGIGKGATKKVKAQVLIKKIQSRPEFEEYAKRLNQKQMSFSAFEELFLEIKKELDEKFKPKIGELELSVKEVPI